MDSQYTDTVFYCNTVLDIPPIPVCGQNMPMGYLDRLSEIRESRGLTQDDLAEKVGVEQPTINRWEKGKREPKFKDLFSLAGALGVSVSDLLDDRGGAEVRVRPLNEEVLARIIHALGPSIPKRGISESAAQALAVALIHALALLQETGATDPTERELAMAAHAAVARFREVFQP